jgi:hypothetical protein
MKIRQGKQLRKYSIGVILFIIIILFLTGYIGWNIYQHKVLDTNRHLLLCETLKPGMSISEVSDILNRTGNIIIREADDSIKHTHYSILFTDKKEQDLYGGWFELDFVEGKYNQAYILGFDYFKEICNFGLTPQ